MLLLGLVGSSTPLVSSQGADDTLVLVGVIVAENPADSIALVRRGDAGRARPMRLGAEYNGYILVDVSRDGVTLEGAHGVERLAMGGAQATTVVGEQASQASRTDDDDVWIRRSFSRTEANARLEKEIPVILSDTELTPRVVEGEVRGLELLRLPDGTVLSQSGLLPGDVLKSLNEEPLRGLDSLWKLLAGVAEGDELRLVLERHGEVVRFAYDLTN